MKLLGKTNIKNNRKHIITIFILLVLSNYCIAQIDTVFSEYGKLMSIGHQNRRHEKTGIWRTYNLNGTLLEKNRYKYSYKHGKAIKYENNQHIIEWYYYDLNEKDRLVNGKKILAYYSWGLSFDFNKCDKYSCINIRLAGDAIWRGLKRKVFCHNFIIDIKQKLRFGVRWKRNKCVLSNI